MFCGKCGKQIEEGAVCTCQMEAQAEQATETAAAPKVIFAGLTLGKLVTLGIAAVTFLCHLIFGWYSLKISMFGVSESDGFGPYGGPTFMGSTASLGEMSGVLSFTRVLAIINIIVFLAYIAWAVVDLKKYVPALANIKLDLGKLLHIGFYGLMALALVFGLIGTFTVEQGFGVSVTIGFGWVITLIFTVVGLVNIFKPEILDNLLAKTNK